MLTSIKTKLLAILSVVVSVLSLGLVIVFKMLKDKNKINKLLNDSVNNLEEEKSKLEKEKENIIKSNTNEINEITNTNIKDQELNENINESNTKIQKDKNEKIGNIGTEVDSQIEKVKKNDNDETNFFIDNSGW